MNKIKFLMSLSIMLLGACSDKENINSPDNDPADSSNSQGSQWNLSFPVSVDESKQTIDMQMNLSFEACQIIEKGDDYSTKWSNAKFSTSTTMAYNINGSTLKMWDTDSENGEVGALTYSGNNSSIFGTWSYDSSDNIMTITKDTIYTTEKMGMGMSTESLNIETEIDLANSYFMYDLYACASKNYDCIFNHWHFTKPAPNIIEDLIENLEPEIIEQKNRSMALTINGKNVNINVEHVQLDSLNNGNALITATIQSQDKNCHFEHIKQSVTKELCTPDNLDYITGDPFFDENGDIFVETFLKDNANVFSRCVASILK